MTAWFGGAPVFTHLAALTDERGVFEHALFETPRREHGYCVDDVARALIVAMREPDRTPDVERVAETCLRFVVAAVGPTGRTHNRMSVDGRWTDKPGTGDWWGRALWALGVTVAAAPGDAADVALRAFRRAASVRSPHLRATAFAGLGAAEVIRVHPHDGAARRLLEDCAARIAIPDDTAWTWPETRLSYANAVLPEALYAAGVALDEPEMRARALRMLHFLLDLDTGDGQLSVTGTQGRGPDDRGTQFDQQPIEVAAIADACARAYDVTGDREWGDAVGMAWGWFAGDNDSRTVMFDPATGAGFDGLVPDGRNQNRGAESTVAMLATYQQARRLHVLSMLLV